MHDDTNGMQCFGFGSSGTQSSLQCELQQAGFARPFEKVAVAAVTLRTAGMKWPSYDIVAWKGTALGSVVWWGVIDIVGDFQ
jgi:hypothetical protein